MINIEEFRKYAHQLADWMADYYQNIETYPVKSNVKPGDIFNSLPYMPGKTSGLDHLWPKFIDHPWPELSACC
jgi:aromatic-L-amino-acid decarboxylase